MWAVEARNYGDNADYYYISGLTQEESRKHHSELFNSGEWAHVRSWNKSEEWAKEAQK